MTILKLYLIFRCVSPASAPVLKDVLHLSYIFGKFFRMSDIKFALIGCGRIGTRHAHHISNVGVLVAVCDIDQSKAQALSKECATKAYFSIDSLLKDNLQVDVVAICTPNGLHAEHTIKSLKAGFHVICE